MILSLSVATSPNARKGIFCEGGALQRLSVGRLLHFTWLLSISLVIGQGQSNDEITSFNQFFSLPHAEASKGRPVRLKGFVMCYDAEWNQMHLHDGRDVGYIHPQNLPIPLQFGQRVEITGATTLNEAQPGWTNLTVTILSPEPLPEAKSLRLSDLAQDTGQWIETTGHVRVAETSRGRLSLVLHDSGQNCLVYVMGLPGTNDYGRLLDCKVRVRGINTSKIVQGRLDSASIMVPEMSEVTVLEPPAMNYFQTPVVSIGALLDRTLGSWTNNRVRIRGMVSNYEPGQFLVVKDPTGIMRAQVVQVNPVLRDQRVDVWGFLGMSSNGPLLEHSLFSVVQPPTPQAVPPNYPESPSNTFLPDLLTNVVDIIKLGKDQTSTRIPVRLRGVITFADPAWELGFFQDKGGGIFFPLKQNGIQAGQWVDLTGHTGPGGFAPIVDDYSVEILGMTNLPPAARVELLDLWNGNFDAHWIQLEGVVQGVSKKWGHVVLRVMNRQGMFKALLPDFESQDAPTHLIDAHVSIRGACGSDMNARGQLSGITLHVPDLEQIIIHQSAPPDPFTIETTRIGDIATFDPNRLNGRRIKVSGVITLRTAELGYFLQDASGGVRMVTQQTDELFPGDLVEVLGFPNRGDFSPVLDEAIFRVIGEGTSPVPEIVTAESILLHGTNDGVLVKMTARLIQDVHRSLNPQLVLQEGPVVFRAQIETPTPGLEIPVLASGSLLQVTGVCNVEGNDLHEPKSFRLRVRHPSDIQLLEAAPWWNFRHTLVLAGGLLLLIAAALLWAFFLRRQVRAQTEVIRGQLDEGKKFTESLAREKNLLATLIDHLPDSVFIKDTEGRFLLTNHAHTQFHGAASKENFYGKSVFELFPKEVAQRLAETDEKVIINGVPLFDIEFSLKDVNESLRWLSTTKVPLKDGTGAVIGLVGISRDVTEQKLAKVQLEKLHKDLLEASRRGGMAEIATNVLHNVGNALNSVNVSTSLIVESVRKSRVGSLARVVALLQEHHLDPGTFFTIDPKGKQIPAFLAQLSEHLIAEQKAMESELHSLRENVVHIKEIVAMQQSYAMVGGLKEMINPVDLVEESLRMNELAINRHGVEIIREFEKVPAMNVEKHKVLLILVNLLNNAKYACQNSEQKNKHLTVRLVKVNGHVRISVIDNGIGIPTENLIRIFNHGFTTRKNGHGFGLHSSALAAKELGGSLTVHSDGLDQGAAFTLELPA